MVHLGSLLLLVWYDLQIPVFTMFLTTVFTLGGWVTLLPSCFSPALSYLSPSFLPLPLPVVYSGVNSDGGWNAGGLKTLWGTIFFCYYSGKFQIKCAVCSKLQNIWASLCGGGVMQLESGLRSNNSDGQLREQECGLLIMWTGYYNSLVIGSQGLHQSHKFAPHT